MKYIYKLFTFLILIVVFNLAVASEAISYKGQWIKFKTNHISNGYVIDSFSKKSHSEGQGLGLILAAKANDLDSFKAILSATERHQKSNHLFKWSFIEDSDLDSNNASDGDIYIAWGLLKGYQVFHNVDYLNKAKVIISAISDNLIKSSSHGLILIPAQVGFESEGVYTINMSYWVFPAFNEFYRVTKDPVWLKLSKSGKDILEYSYFGKYKLPPDWLELSDPVKVSSKFKPNFSYDAIRVPLFLKMANISSVVISRYEEYAKSSEYGAVFNLESNSSDNNPTAIFKVVSGYVLNKPQADSSVSSDYFAYSLYLLTLP